MSDTLKQQKAALRREIRSRYAGDEARTAQSEAICRHIRSSVYYQQAACVAAYMPLRREADVTPLLRDALAQGKRLLLPRVEGDGVMTFRRIERLDQLIAGSYGLLEPAPDTAVADVNEAELLLVPLEGIDREGRRLGKGGGYYDRVLPGFTGTAMGVALSWQWEAQIPAEPWDVRLPMTVDHTGLIVHDRQPDTISP